MDTKKYFILLLLVIILIACGESVKEENPINLEDQLESDIIYGDEINFDALIASLDIEKSENILTDALIANSTVPKSRGDLEGMKTVVKIYDGKTNAGIRIPGFGGLTLDKRQSNLNLYYLETKVVESPTDTSVYGVGYSVHYLFSKVKRGIDMQNLATVAASAELENNKTSVNYSLQSYGITGQDLAKFFKPEANSNFDVNGFGVIQTKLNGIHNVLTDSLLSERTKYTPEKLYFLTPEELRY